MNKLARLAIYACALAIFVAALWSQSPTVVNRNGHWPPNSGVAYSYGGPFEIYYQALPTTLTDVDTRDMRILSYCFYNSTGGSLPLTIQTKDTSPLPLPLSGSLAATTSVCFGSATGVLSKGGMSVSTTATGVYYSAVWTH